MKNLNFPKRHFLIALFSGLLAITFLITPAMSEMTPEQKLVKAKELAAEASTLAVQAKETGDIALAQQAKDKANEAAQLISEVTVTAQETGNTELAQAAYNDSMELSTAIAEIIGAAAYIAQTSTDSGTVDAANDVLADIGDIQDLNSTNIELALDTGAVPGETAEAYETAEEGGVPVVGDDSPIDDSDVSSPV